MQSRALTFGTAVALAVTLGLVPASFAAGQESEDGQAEDDARALRRLPAFGALDTDDDGEISAAEIDAAPESLASLDGDGGGSLSEEELRPPGSGPIGGPARTPPEATTAFMTFDADGDGALEGTELPSQLRSLLARADADGDGAASEAEILALMAAEGGDAGEERPGAEDRERTSPGAGEGDARRPRPGIPLMTALDTDRDGTISESEIGSAAQSLRSLDTDGDGRLAPDELRPATDGEPDYGDRQQ